jgi:hypothetical protein
MDTSAATTSGDRPDECEISLECSSFAAGFEDIAGSTGVQVHLIQFQTL